VKGLSRSDENRLRFSGTKGDQSIAADQYLFRRRGGVLVEEWVACVET
jgi:hypothetical protein